jgi:hypothetical protein
MTLLSHRPVGPPAEHILEEEVGDEVLLYDPERKVFVALNRTASDIWRLATGEFTCEEIVIRLAESYTQDPEGLRQEVEGAIDGFIEAGLVPPVA